MGRDRPEPAASLARQVRNSTSPLALPRKPEMSRRPAPVRQAPATCASTFVGFSATATARAVRSHLARQLARTSDRRATPEGGRAGCVMPRRCAARLMLRSISNAPSSIRSETLISLSPSDMTPYLAPYIDLAASMEMRPSRTSRVTSSCARVRGSPRPAPPGVIRISRSPASTS